jgi:hypothetical protein
MTQSLAIALEGKSMYLAIWVLEIIAVSWVTRWRPERDNPSHCFLDHFIHVVQSNTLSLFSSKYGTLEPCKVSDHHQVSFNIGGMT